MLRIAPVVSLLLAAPLAAWAAPVVVLSEDFESGLGGWATKMYADPGADNENTPQAFDSSGANLDAGGDDLYGDNDGYPGSQSVGFSTNIFPAWDGINPQWMQRNIAAAVPPGTYTVTIASDRYMWWCRAWEGANCYDASPTWQAANQILVLTDGLYDDGLEHLEDVLGTAGVRRTMWTRLSENGSPAWDTRTDPGDWIIGYSDSTSQITTATGNVEIRLQLWEKSPGQLSAAWDNLTITLVEVGNPGNTWTLNDDFEAVDPLVNWTYKLPGVYGQVPAFRTFTSGDADLYTNADNPGTTSAGYSTDWASIGGPNGFWAQMQFPAAVDPGTYTVTYEYDAYIYKYPDPNNDAPTLFDAAGTGIHGPNTGYPGSQSVGVTYSPGAHDGTEYTWFEQLFPADIPAGTYDITLEADVYVYKAGANGFEIGSRILFLTEDEFDNDGINPDGDIAPGFRKSTWNQESAGTWLHINQLYEDVVTTGDLEFRLVAQDKMQTGPGPITIAWDNVSFTITEIDAGPEVFTLSDDFESGMGNWTYVKRGGDPFGAGNRMYVLTDDQYDDAAWDFDQGDRGHGFSVDYWPGRRDNEDVNDYAMNGHWRHVVTEREVTTDTGNIEVRLLLHDKAPGDQAIAWDNLTLTFSPPPPACPNGELRFDWDNDTDVDGDDFGYLQGCFTGTDDPDEVFDFDACRCMNSDGDVDIDQADYQAFAACGSGPDVAANIACDDALSPP